jgi:hypothetical protein
MLQTYFYRRLLFPLLVCVSKQIALTNFLAGIHSDLILKLGSVSCFKRTINLKT